MAGDPKGNPHVKGALFASCFFYYYSVSLSTMMDSLSEDVVVAEEMLMREWSVDSACELCGIGAGSSLFSDW